MSTAQQQKQHPETPQKSGFTQLEGKVKAVLSGDTLVLSHPTKNVDKTLTLASIEAPRLARRNEDKEEDYAFEAREFLRKKCIGKKVKFQVEYTNPKTGRDYGSVFLDNENVGAELLANGLAKLKEKNDKNQSPEYKELLAASEKAKHDKVGLYSEDKKNYKARKVVWVTNDKNKFDAEARLNSFKRKPVDVIVEQVLNGSSLRVLLPTHEVVIMNMTGIQAPSFKMETVNEKEKNKKGKEKVASPEEEGESVKPKSAQRVEVAQPFAKEARYYTEMRLLNREVTVLFEGVDKFNNLFGTIIISEDEKSKDPVTYQEELLLKGLAKLVEFSAAHSKYLPRFRAAENIAKQQKQRIWKDYKAPEVSLSQQDTKEFPAKVLDILSGDTLRIKNDKGEEEKISLSSIRAPRMGNRKDDPAEPWAHEARECLRRQIAGKKISVRVDYRKNIERSKYVFNKETKQRVQTEEKDVEERRFCSVIVNGRSVAVEIVKEGFASVIRHKSDEERSMFYDQLMAAELEAQKKGKGKYGKKPPVHQIKDLSGESVGVVEKNLAIVKGKQTKGIVERVVTGTRYKIHLPQQSMIILFALNGVTSPSLRPRDSDKPKPFAREAIEFAVDNLLFREVDVVIGEKVDKTGSMVGDLLVKGENFAVKLLEKGYAMLQRSAAQLKNYQELREAEEQAKGPYDVKSPPLDTEPYPKGINVWSVPLATYQSKRASERRQATEKPVSDRFTVLGGPNNSHKARATSIDSITQFYIQTATAEPDLAHLEEDMAKLDLDQRQPPSQAPAPDTLCFAKYTVDGTWYRARVVDSKDNKLTVRYIDFGNTERVDLSDIRSLDKDSNIGKMKPIAIECALAFIEPHKEKYREEANQAFRDMIEDRDFIAIYEYSEGGVYYITIEEDEGKSRESVNETLLRDGLVFLSNSYKLKQKFAKKLEDLKAYEQAACKERLCLWEDGDVYGDDDEDL